MMNILIVEDERIILDEIQSYVREFDQAAVIQAFDDPLAALAACRQLNPEIALLDIQMPDMHGLELANILITDYPKLKIVFITAHNCYGAEAFDLEAADYLLKPVRKDRLFRALSKLDLAPLRTNLPDKPVQTEQQAQILAFGGLTVRQGSLILQWKRKKSAEIFAYLLTSLNQPISKHRICDDLWPELDPDKALVNLQTAVYQLRKSLIPFAREEIKIEYINNNYRLVLGPCYYDVLTFESLYDRAFAQNPPVTATNLLKAAYRIYPDHFLASEGWLWSIPKQSELEKKFYRVLVALIDQSLADCDQAGSTIYLERLGQLLGEETMDRRHYLAMRQELREFLSR